MLGWLYDIFVAVISFIMSLLGFDLTKRTVTFAEGTKDNEQPSQESNKIEEPLPKEEVAVKLE